MFKKPKSQRAQESFAAPVVPAQPPAENVSSVRDPMGTASKALYEIGDMALFGAEQLTALIRLAEDEAHDGLVSCAHLVVTRDLSTGLVNHHVPCNSGLEALTLAAQVVTEKRAAEPGRAFTVTVTPLLPHQ